MCAFNFLCAHVVTQPVIGLEVIGRIELRQKDNEDITAVLYCCQEENYTLSSLCTTIGLNLVITLFY